MKNILILIIAMIISSGSLLAQENQAPKHELGVGIVNLFSTGSQIYPMPYIDIYYPYPYYYYGERPTFGINYRLHGETSALRIGLNLGIRTERSDNYYSKSNNLYSTTGLRLGYEFHKDFNRVQLFYGADIFGSYKLNNNHYENKGTSEQSEYKSEVWQFGLSPLAGVRYYITPNLSVSTETQLRAFYRQAWDFSESGADKSTSFNDGYEIGFAPLGNLSFNIHF